MNLNKFFGRFWIPCLILPCMLCMALALNAANTTISFTLDEPCKTSAGVYSNNVLIRTLWNKVPYYSAGTYIASWNGLDDNSNSCSAGTYQIKLLQNNVQYVWDGSIGNTSSSPAGSNVFQGFEYMQDMAITGTNAFFSTAYNEGHYDFQRFVTTNPKTVSAAWFWTYYQGYYQYFTGNIYDRNWSWITSDGTWVYFGCSATCNPTNNTNNTYPGCVVACNVSDNSIAYFTNGLIITNCGSAQLYSLPNGIYAGTRPGLSGLSVQQNSNLLAVSVAPDNLIYLLDKRSGAAISSFAVTAPGRINFATNGDLWAVSGANVLCYTNVNSSPTLIQTISGLSLPLDVAVCPTNPNIILVADGGGSQQVKAFNGSGTPLWTYGVLGGYPSNGVAVATNKFWFSYNGSPSTFLCYAPDGSFWVGDEENHRTLHFSAAQQYIEQIMYQPQSYRVSVDQNNNSRVFNQFLEFNVDYTKPLSNAWTLVNNWGVNVPNSHISFSRGLYNVTTLTNGRTYALIDNTSFISNGAPTASEICELTNNQLRLTGILPFFTYSYTSNGTITISPNGTIYDSIQNQSLWYSMTLAGFDTNNNPVFNPPNVLATSSQTSTDPVPRTGGFGNNQTVISTNNVLISLDSSLNNGWHLGGIQLGTTNWLWKVSPSANLNGLGNYEIAYGIQYGGNTPMCIDRNVVYGFHGEFFRGMAEASQHMHYYDDGLFVGQFGESSIYHFTYEWVIPAFAGNGFSPAMTKTTNGNYYIWVNDEGSHGPQRWDLVNARNIREQIGNGTLGGLIALTNQSYGFPTGVVGVNGNQSGEVSWLPLPNANSYNVYYSLINGGPYNVLTGNTAGTNYFVSGLANGQTYYFAVTAVVSGTEGIPSEQVEVSPFDTTQTVLGTGHIAELKQTVPVIDVTSTALASNSPSFTGTEYETGVLTPTDLCYYGFGFMMNKNIGTQGYLIYDYGGPGVNLTNLASNFTVTNASGFVDGPYFFRLYNVNGSGAGTNYYGTGLVANPVGTINIGVNDNNFHYLTVVSPAQFCNPRNFTLGVTSTNGTSFQYPVSESNGYTHIFQFLFKGNITLRATGAGRLYPQYNGGACEATVQALFLDNASFYSISPPTGLHAVTNTP